ncbi:MULTISPECIES: hypothetical protein [Providencia]|uniref:hypothetical protein n=1 Tax=Providencia TaxID=586 RepID=UPI001E43007D|nr:MULTISPECIES: hypothetical protein [Providencia]
MPIPLIVAGAGLMTLGGLAAVTHEASKIGFPSSSGSGDDEWGDNTSYGDKIREYESIAIGGELGDEEKKRGNNQGASVGATAGASVGVAAIEANKGCEDCPAMPYIVPHQNDIPIHALPMLMLIKQEFVIHKSEQSIPPQGNLNILMSGNAQFLCQPEQKIL